MNTTRRSMPLFTISTVLATMTLCACNQDSHWFRVDGDASERTNQQERAASERAVVPAPPASSAPATQPHASDVPTAPQPSPQTSATAQNAIQPTTSAASNTRATPETLVPFDGRQAKPGELAPISCEFPAGTVPANTRVYAAGAYSGRELNSQIDQSGHQATRIDVSVNKPGENVALILGAYEPTIWNVGWSRSTRIVAVLVSGYHRQAIAGLPAHVPVINSSYDNRGPCGNFYIAEKELPQAVAASRRLFNRPISMVYPARDGVVSIGAPAGGIVTSDRVKPESFVDQDAPLAGPEGLADAVRRGLMREARGSDVSAWKQAYRRANHQSLPPIAGGGTASSDSADSGRLFQTYVVLKAMRLPAGLYGANSATFIVPKGVPRPTGQLGHSQLYDYNTMTCAGATCGMGED